MNNYYISHEWWKVVVYSNMKKSDRYNYLESLWIEITTSKYAKPDSRWFDECINAMSMDKNKVVMIWDNFLTDGWSIQAWIDFIKVKPILTHWDKKSLSRVTQVFARKIIDRVPIIKGNI